MVRTTWDTIEKEDISGIQALIQKLEKKKEEAAVRIWTELIEPHVWSYPLGQKFLQCYFYRGEGKAIQTVFPSLITFDKGGAVFFEHKLLFTASQSQIREIFGCSAEEFKISLEEIFEPLPCCIICEVFRDSANFVQVSLVRAKRKGE